MRQRILGGIGVVWGGLMLINRLLRGGPAPGNGSYVAGQNVALVFGVLLFAGGLYYVLKRPSRSA
jgi:hypothetical protein